MEVQQVINPQELVLRLHYYVNENIDYLVPLMTNSRILFILESHILLTSSFSDNIYVTTLLHCYLLLSLSMLYKKCTSLKSQNMHYQLCVI